MICCRTIVCLLVTFAITSSGIGQSTPTPSENTGTARLGQFLEEHCFACHGYGAQEAGLAIDELLKASVADHTDRWETIVRKLAARQMPPVGETRPEERVYNNVVSELAAELDRKAAGTAESGADRYVSATQSN